MTLHNPSPPAWTTRSGLAVAVRALPFALAWVVISWAVAAGESPVARAVAAILVLLSQVGAAAWAFSDARNNPFGRVLLCWAAVAVVCTLVALVTMSLVVRVIQDPPPSSGDLSPLELGLALVVAGIGLLVLMVFAVFLPALAGAAIGAATARRPAAQPVVGPAPGAPYGGQQQWRPPGP